MSLYRKVREVERVFIQLEKDLAAFKQATPLSCATGCNLCCHKKDIHATVLEFLPLAYYLYRNGQADAYMDELIATPEPSACINLDINVVYPSGGCRNYAYRGLICRLFGFSAMTDKHGALKLVTCKTIKTTDPISYQHTLTRISRGLKVPIMKDYYYRLRFIDPDLGTSHLPVNQAILQALKVVLGYYSYRRPRKAG